MHHLDAAGYRIGGPRDADRCAVDKNLALIWHGKAVEDVHESGLTGAVLAQQGVDLAPLQVEIDVIVGGHPRVTLGDATHLQLGNWRWLGVGGHRSFAVVADRTGAMANTASGDTPKGTDN